MQVGVKRFCHGSRVLVGLDILYATVRWIDINNRSHSWSGEVASHDRKKIILQVKSQTGAMEVIIQSVKG